MQIKSTAIIGMIMSTLFVLFGNEQHATGQSLPRVVRSEFIYETAPFPECHASTLADTREGLVAAWFGGTKEKNPDVGIWVSRLVKGGWTAPVEVANGIESPTKRYPTWNPVLFNSGKELILFY